VGRNDSRDGVAYKGKVAREGVRFGDEGEKGNGKKESEGKKKRRISGGKGLGSKYSKQLFGYRLVLDKSEGSRAGPPIDRMIANEKQNCSEIDGTSIRGNTIERK